MGRVGAAGDNAAMESFFGLLQKNVLDRRTWATREQLRIAIVTWIERTYHRRRRQHPPRPVDPHRVRDHHDHTSRTGCVTTTCHLSVQQTPNLTRRPGDFRRAQLGKIAERRQALELPWGRTASSLLDQRERCQLRRQVVIPDGYFAGPPIPRVAPVRTDELALDERVPIARIRYGHVLDHEMA